MSRENESQVYDVIIQLSYNITRESPPIIFQQKHECNFNRNLENAIFDDLQFQNLTLFPRGTVSPTHASDRKI